MTQTLMKGSFSICSKNVVQSMAVAKTSSMLKVNQLSKDLNIKSKDMSEIMTAEGIEYKAQKVLTPLEFSILFDKLTKDNQINGIDDYLDGITGIPSKKKEEPKAEEAPVVEVKSEVKPEPVKEEVKAEPVKPEVKAEPAKSEQKPATKVNEIKEAPKATAPKAAPTANTPRQDRPVRQDRPAYQQGAQSGAQRPQGARQGFAQGNDRAQGGFQRNERNDRGFASNDRGQQNAQRGGQQKGNNSYQQGGRQGGFYDKDDRQQSAPKNTFKAQPIVRGQTGKADETKPRGATRVVDMRGGSVDLSKYDEKLDSFVPDSVSDMRGGMQRVKKQGKSH